MRNVLFVPEMEINQQWLISRRIRISLFFFFYGFIFATWASRIPDIQQQLNLTETKLGAVLLAMPVGSFITLPFSGYVTSKIGSRKVVMGASFIYGCILIAIGFSPSVWVLTLCLFLFGSSGNMMNISVNTQALELEKLYKKTIISSFHGMWSVAGLCAAFSGSYFMGKAFPVSSHFLLVAVIGIISFLLCAPYLLKEKLKKQEKRPLFTKPDKAFWGLGIIAFCSMICQGAMFDWSGVYFRKVVVPEPAFIGAGYTAFMVSMTAVRFITDWFSQRLGFEKIIALCGLCTTCGFLVTVLFPSLVPATLGMLLVGIGVSP